jgi:hypothetical protein
MLKSEGGGREQKLNTDYTDGTDGRGRGSSSQCPAAANAGDDPEVVLADPVAEDGDPAMVVVTLGQPGCTCLLRINQPNITVCPALPRHL